MRAKTEAFEREALREAIRATSEIRRDVTPSPATTEEERQTNKYIDEAHRRADQVIYRHRLGVCISVQRSVVTKPFVFFRSMVRDIADDTNRTVRNLNSATRRYEDNISKKMADIRMSPWRDGVDFDQEYKSSKESRARISGLERELHQITLDSMAYR